VHALAAEIRTAAGRIGALVEATKAVTAMDRDPDLEPVDLPAVLRSAISILEPERVDLAVTGRSRPCSAVRGPRPAASSRLLRNGLQSGGRVTVEVSAQEAAWVQVAVEDDGPRRGARGSRPPLRAVLLHARRGGRRARPAPRQAHRRAARRPPGACRRLAFVLRLPAEDAGGAGEDLVG
jgi:hypothetical protein